MIDDDPTTGDWFERTLFVIAVVVFLFLGATGPWQAGGPSGNGGCPVEADDQYVPSSDQVEGVDGLERGMVFVDERPAHTADRRCLTRSLAAGESTEVGGVTVAVLEDGTVLADSNPVPEEQPWIVRSESVRITDLWYTYNRDLVLYNAGPVDGIRDGSDTREVDREVVLVTGSMSNTARLNLTVVGVFAAATLIVVGIGLEWSVRYSGRDLWDESGEEDGDEE